MASASPRPASPVTVLEAADRKQLEQLAAAQSPDRALALRAEIVLAAARGAGNAAIARELGVSRPTVRQWRWRYAAGGLGALADRPRPGRPRTVAEATIAELLVRALAPAAGGPEGALRSTRALAREAGISQASVSRLLRHHELDPATRASAGIAGDPASLARLEQIARLCVATPATVRCLRLPPAGVGHPTGRLRSALRRSGGHRDESRSVLLVRQLNELAASRPRSSAVHVVVDDEPALQSPAVRVWLTLNPRFSLHPAPAGSSLTALAERWLALPQLP